MIASTPASVCFVSPSWPRWWIAYVI